MYWTGRPRHAASLAAASLETAPAGITRAALYSSQARALSLIGAREEVRTAIDAADHELQRAGDDPFFDIIDAELICDQARHTIQAGSSFLALGDGEQAEAQSTTALQLLSDVAEQDRWMDGYLAARADLATARILRHDLAGAEDALGPVFAVNPELRTECVVKRLVNLGRLLGLTRYHNAREAAHLGEEIENFTSRGFPHSTTQTITNPAG